MTLLMFLRPRGGYIQPDPSPARTLIAPERDRDATASARGRTIVAPPRDRSLS